jgi:hypothetical protein
VARGTGAGQRSLEPTLAAISADREVAAQVVQIAGSAVLTAALKFGLQLDFSVASLEGLDNLLEELHKGYAAGEASEDQVDAAVAVWGVYLGEVIRRHRSGTWSRTELPKAGTVLQVQVGSQGLLPLSRVRRRIREGASRSVRAFYDWAAGQQALVAEPTATLRAFVTQAVDIALGFIPPEGQPMSPFLLVRKGEGNTLESYAALSTDKAIPLGRRRATQQAAEVGLVAFVYDGYLSHNNEPKADAIMIEAHERGLASGIVFGQCYRRGAGGGERSGDLTTLSGCPAFLGAPADPGPAEPAAQGPRS